MLTGAGHGDTIIQMEWNVSWGDIVIGNIMDRNIIGWWINSPISSYLLLYYNIETFE